MNSSTLKSFGIIFKISVMLVSETKSASSMVVNSGNGNISGKSFGPGRPFGSALLGLEEVGGGVCID